MRAARALLLATALALTSYEAARGDPPASILGVGDLKFGMTLDAFKQAYPSADCVPNAIICGTRKQMSLSPFGIYGNFSAFFRDGRLWQISVINDGTQESKMVALVLNQALGYLSQYYGPPNIFIPFYPSSISDVSELIGWSFADRSGVSLKADIELPGRTRWLSLTLTSLTSP